MKTNPQTIVEESNQRTREYRREDEFREHQIKTDPLIRQIVSRGKLTAEEAYAQVYRYRLNTFYNNNVPTYNPAHHNKIQNTHSKNIQSNIEQKKWTISTFKKYLPLSPFNTMKFILSKKESTYDKIIVITPYLMGFTILSVSSFYSLKKLFDKISK